MPLASDRSRLISIVQSRQNARVRELRAAFVRSGREVSEVIGIEGEHLIAEALRSQVRLRTVFVRRDPAPIDKDRRDASLRALDRLALPAAVPIVELTPAVFDSAVDTESPQGIAALVEPPRFSFADTVSAPNPLVVLTAALQDPGNFGTLIRSVEAFAASGVIALPGTVSAWNHKALRASDAIPCSQANLTGPAAFLIGNEGSGLSSDLIDRATARIAIPMPGPVESLNAAVAASILLYEAARQRAALPAILTGNTLDHVNAGGHYTRDELNERRPGRKS